MTCFCVLAFVYRDTVQLKNNLFYESGSQTQLNLSKSSLTECLGPKKKVSTKYHCNPFSGSCIFLSVSEYVVHQTPSSSATTELDPTLGPWGTRMW